MPRWIQSNKRSFGIYASGALFSFAWWIFFDALLLSSIRSKQPPILDDPSTWIPPPVKMSFADWVPGLLATLGMIVVNLIDKSVLAEAGGFGAVGGFSSGSWGGDSIQWRARLFLFVGFALLAGGLAGSVTVLTIKYIIADLPSGYEWYGFSNVVRLRCCFTGFVVHSIVLTKQIHLVSLYHRFKMRPLCYQQYFYGLRRVQRATTSTTLRCNSLYKFLQSQTVCSSNGQISSSSKRLRQ